MKYAALLFIWVGITMNCFSQNKEEQMIRNILNQQTIEWNKGNLDQFMAGYWENDSLVFIGKSGPVYGYLNALKNYKKGYPDTATMGKLNFEIVSVRRLSADHYFVIGKWFLKRSVGDAKGVYTLLFKKINGQWKIIVDHSS
jgi:ketosteroid isomerase-like protein